MIHRGNLTVHQSLFLTLSLLLVFFSKLSGQKKSSKIKSGYGQESFQIECFTIYDENFNWGCTTVNLLGIKLSAELKENVDLD